MKMVGRRAYARCRKLSSGAPADRRWVDRAGEAREEDHPMEVSARNQLPGKVTALALGTVMAEVTIDIGDGKTIVAAITRSSAEQLGLGRREGAEVVAVIKATEVMVGKR